MSKQALVIIDIQNDYFPGGKWTLDGADAAADNAARLLAAARERGDLVVHVRHEFDSAEAPFFAPGSEGAQIHAKVAPAPGEPVVLKHQVNAFRDTDLKALLDQHAVQALTIVGSMSHMCIDAATRAAADHGYQVAVAHDACATLPLDFAGQQVPAAQVQAASMAALAFAYARVENTDTLLGEYGR
ncbi:cysteine hydrolase [Pseudomonas guariconensis]|uniref:cysteine hydrolase family protein n=1 Tax=Pseudomonas TaxID=286 RepID=UPI0020980495|nr:MULTISPECIES: cysteine hydrolase family protein [Pseudomonas]MCO7641775.1 cysteine hydrolase [Pseudomonas sp. S 311-6]MCO7517673.1 cysteine hydrolase [Pseudomonas putida]MCO7567964.1 cysteine hydrolase [Pseudomonas mosselii]MCO7596952.1 cysteine hydrolase [Pseudomonas guariconensis]MCO7608146.1 cysteine hydrolase [Pseudomonas guariconensis]